MKKPDPALRRAFLGSSYGTAAERAWLSEQPSDAANPPPTWAQGNWGSITAWNPAGQQAAEADNQVSQARLEQKLQPYTCQRGHNGEGAWREPTLIAAGISQSRLVALGAEFGQAAVLLGAGSAARLLWLDTEAGKVYGTEAVWLTLHKL